MTIKALFVYGSLLPGAENEKYLKHIKGSWTKAYVYGELITDANIGYPAIKLNEKGDKILGHLFYSDALMMGHKNKHLFMKKLSKKTIQL